MFSYEMKGKKRRHIITSQNVISRFPLLAILIRQGLSHCFLHNQMFVYWFYFVVKLFLDVVICILMSACFSSEVVDSYFFFFFFFFYCYIFVGFGVFQQVV